MSLSAEDRSTWQAIMECPVCGFVATAIGRDLIQSLTDAAQKWNTLASVQWLYMVPGPPGRGQGNRG